MTQRLEPSRNASSRRELISVFLGASLAAGGKPAALRASPKASDRVSVCIFSKHLQWLDWKEMAQTAAQLGFDGVDLTVRKDGHVEPERVEEDLPAAVEAVRKAGLEVPMITTTIADTRSPHAEAILRTAGRLGIGRYRWGEFPLSGDRSIPEQLEKLKSRVRDLAHMNRQYNLCAMYHTHSGMGRVGASMWDLWLLLKDHDARWVSVNFDIGHATVEGGLGGWNHSARLLAPYIRGVAVKDFRWEQVRGEAWRPQWCPLGEGMVRFTAFFEILKHTSFSGPVQLHFEYPLGGADTGRRQLSMDRTALLAVMQRDLKRLKTWLKESQLI